MTSIGIDIIEIERVESAINQWQERFLHRIYTENELILCQGRASSLASRFAAKEAVMKVLGTGTRGISWKDIEILNDSQGKPVINLHGNAEIKARELNLKEISISLSDSKQCAVATAIGV
ncbi:MAG: holo-ACP synthase [Chloroflexota bacterium]|nr:holo-ACP synthase [Chloroflexota bacterium]